MKKIFLVLSIFAFLAVNVSASVALITDTNIVNVINHDDPPKKENAKVEKTDGDKAKKCCTESKKSTECCTSKAKSNCATKCGTASKCSGSKPSPDKK